MNYVLHHVCGFVDIDHSEEERSVYVDADVVLRVHDLVIHANDPRLESLLFDLFSEGVVIMQSGHEDFLELAKLLDKAEGRSLDPLVCTAKETADIPQARHVTLVTLSVARHYITLLIKSPQSLIRPNIQCILSTMRMSLDLPYRHIHEELWSTKHHALIKAQQNKLLKTWVTHAQQAKQGNENIKKKGKKREKEQRLTQMNDHDMSSE